MRHYLPLLTEYIILALAVAASFGLLIGIASFITYEPVSGLGQLIRALIVIGSLVFGKHCWYVILTIMSKPRSQQQHGEY